MNKILEIKNLTKYYGNFLAVDDLSLSLNEGEIFGFIGPNGAGKSTTIRSIMNLIKKTKGKVFFDGEEFDKNNIEIKKKIGYLPSEVHLYDDLTVKEMLDYNEKFFDNVHKRREELVNLLRLDESKRVEDLSLGNSKKLDIVLSLMHSPKILILDEPTSGLDPIMQNVFYNLLIEEKKKGTTIFYSTHILSEVSKICDRVGIIKNGKLLKVQNINELIKNNLNYVTIESKEIDKIIKELNIKTDYFDQFKIKFKNSIPSDNLIKMLSKYTIDNILIEEATLEDIFMHYYK